MPDGKQKVKKKLKTVDYGKIATAIGKFQSRGIAILPPDINQSSYTFTPLIKQNAIAYGLRGITRVPESLIKEILASRPFTSYQDFFSRIKISKLPAVNLIKSGAFDSLGDRQEVMDYYLGSVAELKKQVTLATTGALVENSLIPEEMIPFVKMYNFNKYILKQRDEGTLVLNAKAQKFIVTYCDPDLLIDEEHILEKDWKKWYDKTMEPMREWLKKNKQELLSKLNERIISDLREKYASGNISHWEMDSISFYYHPHELKDFETSFENFFEKPDEPEVDYTFTTKDGQEIKVMKTYFIAGTVIKKDKLKNTVSLLTPQGVVNMKIWKNQYSLYDKQISERDADGTKHVLEKSWFTKGTLLMAQGFRRGDTFVLKKPKKSAFPVLTKLEVRNNQLIYTTERIDEQE